MASLVDSCDEQPARRSAEQHNTPMTLRFIHPTRILQNGVKRTQSPQRYANTPEKSNVAAHRAAGGAQESIRADTGGGDRGIGGHGDRGTGGQGDRERGQRRQ